MAKKNKTTLAAEARRTQFAALVIAGRTATDAAKELGYSPKTAHAQGYRMSHDPRVRAIIEAHQKALLEKHNMTADSVLKQLAAIVHFDIRKLFDANGVMKDIKDLDDETASALASIEVDDDYQGRGEDRYALCTRKVKVFDKNTAIANAMKHFGLLKDNGLTLNAGTVVISSDDAKML